MTSGRWSNLTKIIVSATLALLAIVLLITLRAMIMPTIVAFLLAFILSYPASWIQRRTGWPRGITVGIIYIMLLAVAILAPALLYPWGNGLVDSLQETLEDIIVNLQTTTAGPIFVIGNYQLSVDTLLNNVGDLLQNVLFMGTTNPVSIFRGVTTGVLSILYVLVLSFWILKDMQKLQRAAIDQVPSEYQAEIRMLGHELGEVWHAFLRGQVILAIVIGLMSWAAFWILGMPNPGGLAVLAGFMEFLPTVGPGINVAVATTIAFFRGSTWSIFGNNLTFALIVLLITNIITWIESAYLIPRLVGSRVRLHPAVTFVGVISGAIVFGLMGVLLATPVIASARILLVYAFNKLTDRDPFEMEGVSQSAVRIRGLIAGRTIDGIIFDLDGTLTQIDFGAEDWLAQKTQWLDWVVDAPGRARIARTGMIRLESTVNFAINQLLRFEKFDMLRRFQPLFDRTRGYPPGEELTLQPGVEETLHYLRTQYKLSLVTTRERQTIQTFLQRYCLHEGIFDAVITRESVRNLVPNSESLMLAAQQMETEPLHTLIVSDGDPILRSGSATGMATAGVLSGLDREKDLESADLVLGATAELTEWL